MDRKTARLMEQQLAEAIRLHLPEDLGLIHATTYEGGAPTEVLVKASEVLFVVRVVVNAPCEEDPF